MFSTEGLSHGEIIVTSGLFAFGVLAITSITTAVVTYLVSREPRESRVRVATPSQERLPAHTAPTTAAMAG